MWIVTVGLNPKFGHVHKLFSNYCCVLLIAVRGFTNIVFSVELAVFLWKF